MLLIAASLPALTPVPCCRSMRLLLMSERAAARFGPGSGAQEGPPGFAPPFPNGAAAACTAAKERSLL